MDTGSRTAKTLFAVSGVCELSPSACDRRDLLGAATTQAPCRNGFCRRRKTTMTRAVSQVMLNIKHSSGTVGRTYTD